MIVGIAAMMFVWLFGWGQEYFHWSDPDGKIQLSLRSRLDQTTLATEGQTPARLLVGATPPPAAPVPEKPRPAPAPAPKVTVAAPPPPKPAAPVVEILRGTRVEERKLHSGNSE